MYLVKIGHFAEINQKSMGKMQKKPIFHRISLLFFTNRFTP